MEPKQVVPNKHIFTDKTRYHSTKQTFTCTDITLTQRAYLAKHDGSATSVKTNIKHIKKDFITNILEIDIDNKLFVSRATTYLSHGRPYLPYPNIHKLLYKMYITGDLNAKRRRLGHHHNTVRGNGLATFIRNGKAMHQKSKTKLSHR